MNVKIFHIYSEIGLANISGSEYEPVVMLGAI